MTLSPNGAELMERLRVVLQRVAPGRRFALAYSGGLDSRFLSHASGLLGFKPLLIHVTGVHVGGDENLALSWARRQGFRLKLIELDPLDVEEVARGTRERCYGCKKATFSAIRREAEGLPVCDGTNHSDVSPGVWRPGIRALKELGIESPLQEARLGKPEIHFLAAETGMERPDQLPEPCLLTRLPYGRAPTVGTLLKLKRAEQAVREVLRRAGASQLPFRLRLVAPGRPELHFSRAFAKELTPALMESARQAAVSTAPEDFSGLACRVLDTLSGYYDRQSQG
ncbi:MAG: hypothetical protein MR428_06115 [Mesosutterella sp.]|nr:hypothetical protein [Mesosutterella sp.]